MTTIAKDGFDVSKASNTLKEIIFELVKNKAITENKSGKYIQYSITKSTETLKNSQTSPSTIPDDTVTKEGDFTVIKI